MSSASIAFEDLLNINEEETQRWRKWFESQPEGVLDLPLEIARARSVRELIQHIFAVELRYSQRLLGEPETAYEDLPIATVDDLFSIGDRARAGLRKWLQTVSEEELKGIIEFQTRSMGVLKATRRKVFLHTMTHGIRHWAQLATSLREHGHATNWPHDTLMTTVWE